MAIEADAARGRNDEWAVIVWADHGRQHYKDAANHYNVQQYITTQGTSLTVVHAGNEPDPDVEASLAPLKHSVRQAKQVEKTVDISLNENADVVLSAVVTDVWRRFPARKTMLVFVGHGSGILQSTNGPQTKTLSIADMRRGLEQASQNTQHSIDMIVLDTCYGLTLETVYELREKCRYLVGSPGLLHTPGIRWDKVLTDEFGIGTPENTANLLVCYAQAAGTTKSGQIVALNTRNVESLLRKTANLARVMTESVNEEIVFIRLARSNSQSWGLRNELVDLGQLAGQLAQWAQCADVRQAAVEVANACMDVSGIAGMIDDSEDERMKSGIAVYFPATVEEPPLAYVMSEFAQYSLWGQWLQGLWAHTTAMLYGRH